MGNKAHFFRQSGGGDSFIATFRTTANNQNIALPYRIDGTYNGVIDWGDGTTTANNYSNRLHNYAIAGDYDVTVTGLINDINFALNDSTSLNQIKDIKQWGANTFIRTQRFLFNSQSIEVISALDYPQYSNENWERFIASANNLTEITNFSNWIKPTQTSFVLSLGANKFNSPLDFLSGLSISNFNSTLASAQQFNQEVDFLDVSNATQLQSCFSRCFAFNKPINNWNVSNNTRFNGIFNECFVFNQSLSNWDTSNGITFNRMFDRAFDFNQDISNFNFNSIIVSNGLEFFMRNKTFNDYDATYYDNLLIKWASSPSVGGLPVGVLDTIDMGTIGYTSAGASARASILANNKAVTINDGGLDFSTLNLVAQYDFNNNLIDSVGGNSGTGTNITYNSGSFGNEAVFNGTTSEVRTPNNTIWDISNGTNDIPVILDIVVKFGSASNQYVLSKCPLAVTGWEIIKFGTKVYITIYDDITSGQLQIGCDIQTDANGYSRILINYDGQGLSSGLSISINGTSSGVVDGTSNYTSTRLLNTDTTFGRADRRNDNRLNGAISQIKVYK